MEKEQVYTYKRKTKIKRFIPLYIMLAPGIIYLVINNYIPIMGLFIAFKRINYSLGIFKSPWVGLANFEFLFKTSDALADYEKYTALQPGIYCAGNRYGCGRGHFTQ